MTSRERVLKTLNFEEADRIAVDWGNNAVTGIQADAYRNLLKYIGHEEEEIVIRDIKQGLALVSDYVLDYFDVDTRPLLTNPPSGWQMKIDENGGFYDENGVYFKQMGEYFDFVKNPLKDADTIEDLKAFKPSDPTDPARFAGMRERAKYLRENTDKAIVIGEHGSVFYQAWEWRGMQNFMGDFAGDPEFADYLMDMTADWWSAWYETMLKEVGEYVDIMWLGDDWGTQNGPLIQPEQFEKRVQPRIKRVIESMHKYCDGKVAYHSCGSISWAFDSLRDAGVDIIQPVQANAAGMQDSKKIKEMTYGKLVLHGGLDNQGKFAGPTDAVIADVKQKIRDFAPGGGYLFACGHNIQSDCPPENIVAIFDTYKKYGKYPINIDED